MNDLDICKRIAEIEDVAWAPAYPNSEKEFVGLISENDSCGDFPELIGEYNPLTDDALCFRLMVKHGICLRHDYGDTPWVCTNNKIKNYLSRDKSPNKAICLAIIEANKD